jgi:hypothetical protein
VSAFHPIEDKSLGENKLTTERVSEQAEGGNARSYVSPSIQGLIKVLAVPANIHLVRVEATAEYLAHWGSADMYGQGNGDGPEV